MRSIE
jgi:hypothetical protein